MMGIYIKNWSLADWKELLKWAKIGANNAMIGEFAEIEEVPPHGRPVVLCRDCKYSYDSVGGWCCSHGICVDCIVREDFFCADGVKSEES